MSSNVLALLLAHGSTDLLQAFLGSLPPSTVSRLSAVCKQWATAAEPMLEACCRRHNWKQPRRARLQKASSLGLAWRPLFLSKSCRACFQAVGDFAVRKDSAGAATFFLCGKCAKEDRVVSMLQRHRATLDVTGLSGKPLYTKRQSKFCADVSKLSADSIAAASGARAETVRRHH